ncbi:MAG: SIMPL domain-containing protein [Candidatus Krumholzibacteria bacterium]|nr:SIMPL domain-containing protein [Candidatus Krumholzibacteria bacterium]
MNLVTKMGSVALICVVALLLGYDGAEAQGERVRHISVEGVAEIRLEPDLVVITLGVETFDMDLEVAKRDNDTRVTRLIHVADSLGVAREDVRTEYLNIQPQYKNRQDRGNFLRYLVRKMVIVRLRDVSKFETLLSSLLNAGANYVHGIEFRTTKLDQYRNEARALAIKAAQAKAEDMVSQLDLKLGAPQSISERRSEWRSSYGNWGRSRDRRLTPNVVQSEDSNGGPLNGPTQPGQISVTVSVGVSFLLLD